VEAFVAAGVDLERALAVPVGVQHHVGTRLSHGDLDVVDERRLER
jgi:hypothetical protein